MGAARPPPLIFLGPSLPRAEAERLCRAEYGGPIRRGDLGRLGGPVPRVIGIIDGVFHHNLAVSPYEIQEALAYGHRIYGAASMGALRAVELAHAGMVGVGQIYAAFASGAVERDDEVAVVLDPETGGALSEALIGMRLAFREAAGAGLLTEAEVAGAVESAARLHYPLRTYRRVVAALSVSPERSNRLLEFLQHEATGLKGNDARLLLGSVAGDEGPLPPPRRSVARPWLSAAYQLGPRPGPPPPVAALDRLPAAPKAPGWTSVRTISAAETDARLALVRRRFGVTRVAEITGLDTLGIPCFSAVFPGSLSGSGISVYSGKSLDRTEARVGAQMEALESALVRDDRVPMHRGRYQDLAGEMRALDPERLAVVGTERRDLRHVELEWVPGWDLRDGGATWVPAGAVYFRPGPEPPWLISSNGLASGNCLVEALAHALAELIERDAETVAAVATEYAHLPALMGLLAGPPRVYPPGAQAGRPVLAYPWVELQTLPAQLRAAVAQIEGAGAAVDLRWVASDIEVPVFQCLIHESQGPATMTHAGAGAHPDATVAARRALTEAAQSRATFIHGAREDLRSAALRVQDTPGDGWFDPDAPRVAFSSLDSHRFADVLEDLRFMAGALARAGLEEIIAVELSHPEIPFAVARVIVPGLEAPLDFRNRDRVALGWRARRLLNASASTTEFVCCGDVLETARG